MPFCPLPILCCTPPLPAPRLGSFLKIGFYECFLKIVLMWTILMSLLSFVTASVLCFGILVTEASGILMLPPRIEPARCAMEGQSLNHWTTREVAPWTLYNENNLPVFLAFKFGCFFEKGDKRIFHGLGSESVILSIFPIASRCTKSSPIVGNRFPRWR